MSMMYFNRLMIHLLISMGIDGWDQSVTSGAITLFRCKKNLNNFFVFNDTDMGLESLESGFFGAFCDTKPFQLHIKPETQYIAILIINTSRGLVFTMEEFTFHTINTFYA